MPVKANVVAASFDPRLASIRTMKGALRGARCTLRFVRGAAISTAVSSGPSCGRRHRTRGVLGQGERRRLGSPGAALEEPLEQVERQREDRGRLVLRGDLGHRFWIAVGSRPVWRRPSPIKNTITEPSSSKHVGTNATTPLNKVTFMAH